MKITDRITKLVLSRKPEVGARGFKRDIASTCGVSYEAVRQWFAGDTGNIKNENLIAIAEGYDTTVDWLLSGKGEPPRRKDLAPPKVGSKSSADLVKQMLVKHGKGLSEDARQRIADAVEETALEAKSTNVITGDFSRPGLVGDEVWIAHYDIRAAMGGGQIAHDFPETFQDIRVSPKHLRELGVEFAEHFHLKMVTGWGQSMEPTIKHRDPLIVDVSIRNFVGDGIYLFSWDDHIYIKRLQVADEDHFEMISDNTKHKDRMIRRDMTFIQARVLLVWNAHLV
ncbi:MULTISPECIES: XRE family transcriptional regulator [Pseudomonas]|uniref:XRE family transcriptional regulator n=1 Tax=Pseudomonas TaxID=286 RepID=UPI00215C8FFC|nr:MULTISPECIES: XRE family transcriptional regulator [unclassified Pseudomonas]MCR8931113.1 XRE family transcriptional regulator [Pseudomonas sp. S11A4]MCR8974721.1 XRE family transcriptional regulator [Pseudomonas sp. S11P7]